MTLCGCSSSAPRTTVAPVPRKASAGVTQADAIKLAAAHLKWTDYVCERSYLETVSPYGSKPRQVWSITLRKHSGDTRFSGLVWVDVIGGKTEYVATN